MSNKEIKETTDFNPLLKNCTKDLLSAVNITDYESYSSSGYAPWFINVTCGIPDKTKDSRYRSYFA